MARSAAVVSQSLFLPEDVRLLPSESDVFFSNKEELERFGFVFSDASETSVTLLAVPEINGALLSLFPDVLEVSLWLRQAL